MKRKTSFLTALLLVLLVLPACGRTKQKLPYKSYKGSIFGTYFVVQYAAQEELHATIDEALQRVNTAANPFDSSSVLYAVNNNMAAPADSVLEAIVLLAQGISEATEGRYDVTIGPLVNAWGFGFEKPKSELPGQTQIDSLLQFVGYKKIKVVEGHIEKEDPRIKIDLASVAKGYACDMVARALEEQGVADYLVEIGGEIASKGKNPRDQDWRVGIQRPTRDLLGSSEATECILSLDGKRAVATSGNYRNFRKTPEGNTIGHTLDARRGCPVQTDVLSATIIAESVAKADALATATMVLGSEAAVAILECLGCDYILLILDSEAVNGYRCITSPGAEVIMLKPVTDS